MSDNIEEKEKRIIVETIELPRQQSATDTSNWDDRVSTDPNGGKYIRADDSETVEE